MHMLRKDKDKEEGGGGLMYSSLEKSAVLQEARTFNETPLNSRRCIHILTKILTIINQGETLGKNEATEAFFAMTKLFQSKDVNLRRMVYLVIKDMATIADDVIIVTSSLTKDMTGKEDAFRAPAIRALCRITDSSMLQSIERYMKQAIVDKAPGVSSAALTSALHIMSTSSDLVRRWSNEVQEAAASDIPMVQYHALGVLYHIRRTDKLATAKMVHKFTRGALRSPHAYCLLIRIAAKLLEEEGAERRPDHPLFDFLEACLRNKSEMVIYEAARAIVGLPRTTAKELAPAVSVLQLFCGSQKAVLRFAAVRTLNQVAMRHPAAVTACNLDLEALITDSNRSIATLAITTLLKTGSESSVDRLMKQISSFMSEISDEFKVVVVGSVRALCDKYPRKHAVMMTFLSAMLRDEGGYDFKRAIVDTLVHVIEDSADAKEAGLTHLCEFIEDCEHAVLATRIIHLLGREGPRTMRPGKYIRYIYNRVILEAPQVRAAAVAALAKFGAACEQLRASVLVLLERCALDADDEVRDRATFYWHLLRAHQDQALVLSRMQVSVVGLERALVQYAAVPGGAATGFDLRQVPVAEAPVSVAPVSAVSEPGGGKTPAAGRTAASAQDVHAERLAAVPELAALGPLFKSSEAALPLTESETEYVVTAVKHTFADYLVFQFEVANTLQDQLLEDVSVAMEPTGDADFEVVRTVAIAALPFGRPGTAYTCVRIPDDPAGITGALSCTLQFVVKDCDPATGLPDDPEEGYRDEYVLENVEVAVADHVRRVVKPDFAAAWTEVGPDNEVQGVYELAHLKTLEETVKVLQAHLGLQTCERSERVPEGKSSHVLLLAGLFRGGHDVLVRARLVRTAGDGGVNMEMTVRASDPTVAEIVAAAVG